MLKKQTPDKVRRQSKSLILVVDDEPKMCNVLSRILEKEGYVVATANNGKEALQLTREDTPALILLDLMMPGMNGREVFQRARQYCQDIKVIYFTAKVVPDPHELKATRREADGFLTKPATSKQILSAISRALVSADC